MKNTTSGRGHKALLLLVCAASVGACHFDTWVGELSDDDHLRPPPAPSTTVTGRFSAEAPAAAANSPVAFYLGDGSPVETLAATTGADGTFSISIGGTQSYGSLYAYATSGSVALLGIIPEIPGATSVYDLPRQIDLGQDLPQMDPIDVEATAITLLIEGRLRQQGSSLGNLNPAVVRSAVADVAEALGGESFVAFLAMVDALVAEAGSHPDGVPVFLPPDQAVATGSSLNQAFLTAFPVDYDGDETPDTSTEAYETALQLAMAGFAFDICYDPNLIRVVFMVDFNPGLVDGNCLPRERERWLDGIDDGDAMFIVGGVHEDMVRCEDEPEYEFCATQEDIQTTNLALSGAAGGWIPNQVPMFDDGTNGDATAGDGIYTVVLDLPRGMRVGYKFTYGPGGFVWTGTEEWPGNQRILELFDVNGDGLVVRFDNWGDEATNKDRSNGLDRSLGGTGRVDWDTDAADDGFFDAREIPVDLDGDCIADRFPPAGPVTPLTVECPPE